MAKKKSNLIISKSQQGKRNRAAGARFELKVRKELESQGWILDKWTNNVDLGPSSPSEGSPRRGKLVKAKRKYNPFKKVMVIGTGFTDFIAFKLLEDGKYDIIGVEVKSNGWLDKTEKEKCKWYIENKVFSKILIAKAVREGRRINVQYINFEEKYKKLFE